MSVVVQLFLTASILPGVSESELVYPNAKSAEEVVIVELKIENILESQRIEVPINKNPRADGRGRTGGSSYKDKLGSYLYALDARQVSKRKVKVHFTASFDSEDSIEKDFIVVRGKKSGQKFGHGISLVAYLGKATPN